MDHVDNLDILHHLDHSDRSNHFDNPDWSMINQEDNCRIRIVYLVLFTFFLEIFGQKSVFFLFLCQKQFLGCYYMVYIAFFSDLNLD